MAVYLFVSFIALGLGAWITINGVFQVLPTLAQTVPEGYDIFSYVSVAIACSNIFPIVYGWFVAKRTSIKKQRALDRLCIYFFVGACGVAVCLLMAFLWNTTTHIRHQPYSVVFIICVFVAGGIDSTTSLLFYPVASAFDQIHVTGLLFGEALTGLLASLLAFAQTGTTSGNTSSLNFPVWTYFVFLALFMVIATIGFTYIDHYAKRQQSTKMLINSAPSDGTRHPLLTPSPLNDDSSCTSNVSLSQKLNVGEVGHVLVYENDNRNQERQQDYDVLNSKQLKDLSVAAPPQPSQSQIIIKLFAGQSILSFIENGLYTTMLPHSLSAYQHHDLLVSIAVKVGGAGAAIACGLAYVLSNRTRRYVLWICYATSVACACWMLWSSTRPAFTSTSTHQPSDKGSGAVVIVTLCKWAVSFSKTCLFLNYRSTNPEETHRIYRWGGTGIQTGSLVGAVLFFLLTVTFKVFN
eukprot:gene10364-2498_t